MMYIILLWMVNQRPCFTETLRYVTSPNLTTEFSFDEPKLGRKTRALDSQVPIQSIGETRSQKNRYITHVIIWDRVTETSWFTQLWIFHDFCNELFIIIISYQQFTITNNFSLYDRTESQCFLRGIKSVKNHSSVSSTFLYLTR